MELAAIRAFFMWCTIINVGLFILALLICSYAGDWVYRMNIKWFPIPQEVFNVVIYSFIGLFKLFILVFNIVPYVSLAILG